MSVVFGILYAAIFACAMMALVSFVRESPRRKKVRANVKEFVDTVRDCDHTTCYVFNYVFHYRNLMRLARKNPDYDENFQRLMERVRRAHP